MFLLCEYCSHPFLPTGTRPQPPSETPGSPAPSTISGQSDVSEFQPVSASSPSQQTLSSPTELRPTLENQEDNSKPMSGAEEEGEEKREEEGLKGEEEVEEEETGEWDGEDIKVEKKGVEALGETGEIRMGYEEVEEIEERESEEEEEDSEEEVLEDDDEEIEGDERKITDGVLDEEKEQEVGTKINDSAKIDERDENVDYEGIDEGSKTNVGIEEKFVLIEQNVKSEKGEEVARLEEEEVWKTKIENVEPADNSSQFERVEMMF